MMMVEFTQIMAPHNIGEQRAVPDDVGLRLIEENVAKRVPSIFDDQPADAPRADAGGKKKPHYLSRKAN